VNPAGRGFPTQSSLNDPNDTPHQQSLT
jgi:hypothetical protein